MGESQDAIDLQPVQQANNIILAAHVAHSLPAAMAAIPEALEGMQLSESSQDQHSSYKQTWML